jgi:hypothetical protein
MDVLTRIWLVSGEKGLCGRGFNKEFFGRRPLAGLHYTDGDDITGRDWRSGCKQEHLKCLKIGARRRILMRARDAPTGGI